MKKIKHFALAICLIWSSGCAYTAGLLADRVEDCEGAACDDSEPDSSNMASVADIPTAPMPWVDPAPVMPAELPRAKPTVITPSSRVPAVSRDSIMYQPREFFTVQLAALKRVESVFRYAKSRGISDPLYTRVREGGRNRYVLLLGVYENHGAASQAKKYWVRRYTHDAEPKVRNLGSLQDAVRAAANG